MWKNPRRMAILFFILVPAVILAVILIPRRFQAGETPVAAEEKEETRQSESSGNISLIPGTDSSEAESETLGELPSDTPFAEELPKEIEELFRGYFSAKLSGNAALAYSYFSDQNAEAPDEEKLEEENQRLLRSMEYIEDYQDIVCYGIPGPEEDSYVVYVAYRIKFYQSDVPAPSLSAAYVKKDEDGIFRILEPGRDDPERYYMDQAGQLDSVKELAERVQTEFAEALGRDENLAALCGIIMSGPEENTGDSSSPEEE